jgi:CheY-like chemotaxis protein
MAKSRVLVVDDTEGIRLGLSMLLKAHGFEALTAAGGAEALDLIERTRPDLILLDLSMPEVDGLMVLEQLREWPDCANVPVLVYSAVADEAMKRQARKLGAAEYLEKGNTQWEDLAERILWHLANRRKPDQKPAESNSGPNPPTVFVS